MYIIGGAQLKFVYMLVDSFFFFFFFAGATAPPMGNVAPPLVREIAKWKNKKLWEDRKVR